eukprot:scaffold8698_cov56-Isochrysis_galbana.AAC.1
MNERGPGRAAPRGWREGERGQTRRQRAPKTGRQGGGAGAHRVYAPARSPALSIPAGAYLQPCRTCTITGASSLRSASGSWRSGFQ